MIRIDAGEELAQELAENYWRSLPPVDTLDAHICPQCRRQGITGVTPVEPDFDDWEGFLRGQMRASIRDAVDIAPCRCRISLRHWQLRGTRWADNTWILWEWQRAA
jgi:hypothetical protein